MRNHFLHFVLWSKTKALRDDDLKCEEAQVGGIAELKMHFQKIVFRQFRRSCDVTKKVSSALHLIYQATLGSTYPL